MAEKIRVDFSEIEDSGEGVVPGKYKVRVDSITMEKGDKAPYLMWKLKILDGKCAGLHINHITSLAPSALFNLRNTLIAMGITVPKAAVSIDPDKFIGKTFGIEVAMRPSDGKEYANVKKVFSLADYDGSGVSGTLSTSAGSLDTTSPVPVDTEVSIDLD